MWDLAVREDDYDAVDQMLARYAGAPLSMRIVPAYARRDTVAIVRLREEARNLDARQSQIAAKYLATYLHDFESARELARLDLAPRRNAAIRLGAQTWLAWLEVGQNRWPSANAAFAEAERMEGGGGVRAERALAATLPFIDVPRSDVEAIRRDMEAWSPASETSPAPGLASALRPHLRLYLLSLLSSRLGDTSRALRHARELERLPQPPQSAPVIGGLVATAKADVASRAGRHADVVALLGPANGEVSLELVFVKPFVSARPFTQEHARYLRAEALSALGRTDEALRWIENAFQGSPLELAYRPYVTARRAAWGRSP
ncbi:MAG: hypothetical protein WD825_11645 [Gemmatimonadaceae bacterium]